jgi:hypothetical protein
MTSDDVLADVQAESVVVGLPSERYVAAIRRLLTLDDAVKERDPARYLDTYVELLLRLQDDFVHPFLDESTSAAVREEAERWTGSPDAVTASTAATVLKELPKP